MNTRKILIGSGVAAAVAIGGVFAWTTVWPTAPSHAAGIIARQAHFGGDGGWRGGHGGGRGRGMAMICTDRRDRRIEDGLAFVEGFVNFTSEQTTAWSELTRTIRAGSATIGEKCREMENTDTALSAPDKLARVETLATTGLAILQRIRPAFDRFHATLSDKQRQALDNLISHRGRRP